MTADTTGDAPERSELHQIASPSTGTAVSPATLAAGRRLPSLDGIRALAVIAVLCYHAAVLHGGYLGVDVFFVLSGFLITALLSDERERTGVISLRAFWFRRAFRLLPALMIYLLAGLAAAVVLKGPNDREQLAVDAATSVLGVNNWWRIIGGDQASGAWDGHLWSLSVEAQFYLLWPAVVLVLPRLQRGLRWMALGAMIAGTALWRLMVMVGVTGGDIDAHSYFGTDTRADALLVGALLALLWRDGVLHRLPARVWAWASGLAWLILIMTMLVSPPLEDAPRWLGCGGFTLTALVAAVAVAGPVLASNVGIARFLAWRPVVWLGGVSYALYLWHYPITVQLEGWFGERFGHLPVALVALILTAGFAWLSALLVERPIARKRRAIERKLFRPVHAASPRRGLIVKTESDLPQH